MTYLLQLKISHVLNVCLCIHVPDGCYCECTHATLYAWRSWSKLPYWSSTSTFQRKHLLQYCVLMLSVLQILSDYLFSVSHHILRSSIASWRLELQSSFLIASLLFKEPFSHNSISLSVCTSSYNKNQCKNLFLSLQYFPN